MNSWDSDDPATSPRDAALKSRRSTENHGILPDSSMIRSSYRLVPDILGCTRGLLTTLHVWGKGDFDKRTGAT